MLADVHREEQVVPVESRPVTDVLVPIMVLEETDEKAPTADERVFA